MPGPLGKAKPVVGAYARAYTSIRWGANNDEGAAQAREAIVAAFDKLEAELEQGDGEFLVGERLSVADVTAASLFYPVVVPPEGPLDPDLPRPPALERFRAEPQRPPRLQVGRGDLPQAPPPQLEDFQRSHSSQTKCCNCFARLLSMQTMAPPDGEARERSARIDERFARVDERFDEVNRRITEGREENNRRFKETGNRFDRVEDDIGELKKSVAAIQTTLSRIGFGLALTFASVILTRGF